MLDIYICEDVEKQRAFVEKHVDDYCAIKNLDAAIALSSSNPTEVLQHFKASQNPALFFLDIDLKAEINGIELARRVREHDEHGQPVFIVFLTTHTEMTMMTFQYRLEALDFIAKDSPENIKIKISECIDIALKRHIANAQSKTIKINVDDKIIILDMDEIICVETTHVRHKLRLHAKNRAMEFNAELKTIEEQLDERFIRCHKSYIINKNKIRTINKNDNTVTMEDNNICPVSRSGRKLLLFANL